MNIESKGPTALVFDVSSLMGTIDEGECLSMLAWQYVAERDLARWAGLAVQSTTPKCKSLERQYQQIRSLQDRYGMTIVDVIGWDIIEHLSPYVVAIELTREILVVVKRKRLSWE